jgi:hypothetical protein
MPPIQVQRLWERDDVYAALDEAASIVDELVDNRELPAELLVPAFQLAVQLCTQRAIAQQLGGVHLPAGPLQ